jgi:branched-chain amino acid transport system substrate-binding protein
MTPWRSRLCLIIALAPAVLAVVSGCGGGPSPRTAEDVANAQARRDLEVLETEHQLHRDEVVLARGAGMVAARPDHPLGDAITALMIDSALRAGRLERARDLALTFPARWPRSPRRDDVMVEVADTLAAAGRPDAATRVMAVLIEAQRPGPARERSLARVERWLRALPPAQLEAWADSGGPLGRVAGDVLAAAESTAGPADAPRRVGVLCPLTGRYARFGNAFLQGVQLAIDHVPADARGPWDLRYEDTEADPVLAALAARRLCDPGACDVLIGGLTSSSTATAALVAERHGVAVISPTATSERLSLLGDHVLQTNQTGLLEARLLARLASEVLLKRRFAVIRPETPEGASMAAAFDQAVTELGGEVVIEEVIDPTATDFRRQVRALREARPEVVFAPTTADQMVLLGPQLDFYRVGALVLGPSAWNSSRLMDRAGTVMDRMVFVADAVVYPVEWSAAFAAAWPADEYDEESTTQGRNAYLATRLALTALRDDPSLASQDLAAHLRDGLSGREATEEGPERYATTLRMVEAGDVVPFPGALYTEAWRREQLAALADSLAVADSLALADSLAHAGGPGHADSLDVEAASILAGDPGAADSLVADQPLSRTDRIIGRRPSRAHADTLVTRPGAH